MSDITLEVGTQILIADHAGDYAPDVAVGDLEVATATEIQMTLNGLTDGQARESAIIDFEVNRALWYSVLASVETGTTPTTGEPIIFYLGPTPVSTAGTGNPGDLTGADADYIGGTPTLDEGLAQMNFIGALICSADQKVQTASINPRFRVPERYGILVIENDSGATLFTDDVNMHVVFNPIRGDVA